MNVDDVSWLAEQAGLVLISEEPCGVDADGKELWRCLTSDGVIEPFTIEGIVASALWRGMGVDVFPRLG